MKLMKRVLFVLPVLGLSAIALPNSVSAQCVLTDNSLQANLNGAFTPATQTNDVQLDADGRCTGTVIRSRGVQVNQGGRGHTIQDRKVRQKVTSGSSNPSGVDGPTVKIQPSVQFDGYNPADNF